MRTSRCQTTPHLEPARRRKGPELRRTWRVTSNLKARSPRSLCATTRARNTQDLTDHSYWAISNFRSKQVTRYDPNIINQYADDLYNRATVIVVVHTIAGVLVGGLAGYLTGGASGNAASQWLFCVIGAMIIGGLGYAIGQGKAFELKLQAQVALCQVQIEHNTKPQMEQTSAMPTKPSHSQAVHSANRVDAHPLAETLPSEPTVPGWTCRCGEFNPEGATACQKCRRSPHAII